MTRKEKPCVEWEGLTNADGYGRRWIDGVEVMAHRQVWIDAHGDPGPEIQVHHVCENRPCVELEHLEAMTHAEHMKAHWRTTCSKCDEPYAKVHTDKRGRRQPICRPCRAESCRRWRLRKKQETV